MINVSKVIKNLVTGSSFKKGDFLYGMNSFLKENNDFVKKSTATLSLQESPDTSQLVDPLEGYMATALCFDKYVTMDEKFKIATGSKGADVDVGVSAAREFNVGAKTEGNLSVAEWNSTLKVEGAIHTDTEMFDDTTLDQTTFDNTTATSGHKKKKKSNTSTSSSSGKKRKSSKKKEKE